ncbi:MAG: hypothetical protein HY235_03090, partial [Acidobacteria bacterium]|nr:hypothetical protein [Acidobacteriota bacterium]
MSVHRAVLSVFLLAVSSVSLWGQPSAGLVVVTVQDPSGAAIAGASVTITDETTSVAATQ